MTGRITVTCLRCGMPLFDDMNTPADLDEFEAWHEPRCAAYRGDIEWGDVMPTPPDKVPPHWASDTTKARIRKNFKLIAERKGL